MSLCSQPSICSPDRSVSVFFSIQIKKSSETLETFSNLYTGRNTRHLNIALKDIFCS